MNGSTKKSKRKSKTHGNKWKENTKVQHLWNAAEAVMNVQFLATEVYLKKQEKSEINNLILYQKELEQEQQTKCKSNRKN